MGSRRLLEKKLAEVEKLVSRTLDNLGTVELLEEDSIQYLMDNVYKDGYTGKDKEDFDMVQRQFKQFHNQIVPFIHDNRVEKEFYSLYKSYEVVPLHYKLEYLEEMDCGRYLEAISYFTSISLGQYKKLERENNVEIERGTRFVNTRYDKNLGLFLDEEDSSII